MAEDQKELQSKPVEPELVDEIRELLLNPMNSNNFFKALNLLRLKMLENSLTFKKQSDEFTPVLFEPLPFLALQDYLQEIDVGVAEEDDLNLIRIKRILRSFDPKLEQKLDYEKGIFSTASSFPYIIPTRFDERGIAVAGTWIFKAFVRVNLQQYAWVLDKNMDVPAEQHRIWGDAYHLHKEDEVSRAKELRMPFHEFESRLAKLCHPERRQGLLVSAEMVVQEFQRLLPPKEEVEKLVAAEKLARMEEDFLKPDFTRKYYDLCNHYIDFSALNKSIQNIVFPSTNTSTYYDIMLVAITADSTADGEWANVQVEANSQIWQELAKS